MNRSSISLRITRQTPFMLALAIFYIMGTFKESTVTYIDGALSLLNSLRFIVLILLSIKILSEKYTINEIIKMGVFALLILISYLRSGYFELIYILFFIFAAKGLDFKKVAKTTIVAVGISTIVIITLAEIGAIENLTATSTRVYFWGTTTTELYGFTHHNFLGCRILMCFFSYVFLRYEKYNFRDCVIGLVAFLFLYFGISSKTSAFLILLCMMIILIMKGLEYFENKRNRPLVNIALYSIMCITPIFSIISTVNYSSANHFYVMLNALVYNRFSYAKQVLTQYGISLLGQKIDLVSTIEAAEMGTEALVLDNAYMLLLTQCGVFLTIFLLGCWFLVARYSILKKNYSIAIIVVIYFICGVSEKWLIAISYNPFVILLSIVIFNSNLSMLESNIFTDIRRKFVVKIGK